MRNGKIESIVIVGGGSAGWMTASYLSRMNPNISISLVEASDIPVIGVGEATIAHLTRFMHTLNLKDKDWMPHCNAAYKYGIRFDNWHEVGDQYWHPFEALPYFNSQAHLATYWWYDKLKSSEPLDRQTMYADCFLSTEILKQNKILRMPGKPDFSDDFTLTVGGERVPVRVAYAYHFDAGLFGEYLKNNIAKPAGVNHILDEITNVIQNECGEITKLETKSGNSIEADLFVDCSGFRSLLIEKTLKEPFTSFSDTLFCNKALAMQIPYVDMKEELRPYTTATALSSGWVWRTPLTSRIGTGYVYCDGFIDDDKAESEYRQHLGEDRVKDCNARIINIRVGKFERTWVKNCVAIGLSSGFIEPLESTGLHFIHVAAEKLSAALQGDFYNCGDVLAYNQYMKYTMEEARDMLAIHYGLTNREDSSFWKEVKYNTKMEGCLPDLLMFSKHRFPNDKKGYIFGNNSWVCVLNGMNYMPNDPYVHIPDEELNRQRALINEFKRFRKSLSNQLPNHADYLQKMAKE